MEAKQLISLDVGKARTGIARASNIAKLAEPLTSVETAQVFKKLSQMIDSEATEAIVVGLPRNLDSKDTAQTVWVRDWVKEAQQQINLPFYWQDEALTSKLAELEQMAAKNPIDQHALAAAIILQDFLDAPESQRSLC